MVNKKVEGMSNAKHFMDERECEQTCVKVGTRVW